MGKLKDSVFDGIDRNSKDVRMLVQMIESRIDKWRVKKDIYELSRNKLEDEFRLKDNTYQIVIDYSQSKENISGGLLDPSCVLNLN